MQTTRGIRIQYLSQSQLAATLTDPGAKYKPLLLLQHHQSVAANSEQPLLLPAPMAHLASGLQCIDDRPYELWLAEGEWRYSVMNLDSTQLFYCFNDTYLVGSVSIPLTGTQSMEAVSRHYYEEILKFMASEGKPTPLRMWNYFPSINQVDHELERYQQFCVGRHNAFAACAATAPEYPAASAVGSHADSMTVLFIATEKSGLFLENPDQISAYRYPRQYSPKSPSFARASIYQEHGVTQLYISGTASIVGHESRFHGDIVNQTHQTLKNLRRLIEHSNAQETIRGNEFDLIGLNPAIKVYLRHASDRRSIMPLIEAFAPDSENICYLEADICRQELDIEIEMLLTTEKS